MHTNTELKTSTGLHKGETREFERRM